jgi:hypothetical protein
MNRVLSAPERILQFVFRTICSRLPTMSERMTYYNQLKTGELSEFELAYCKLQPANSHTPRYRNASNALLAATSGGKQSNHVLNYEYLFAILLDFGVLLNGPCATTQAPNITQSFLERVTSVNMSSWQNRMHNQGKLVPPRLTGYWLACFRF